MFHFDVTLKHLPGHGIWHLTVNDLLAFVSVCDRTSMPPWVMKRKNHLVAC